MYMQMTVDTVDLLQRYNRLKDKGEPGTNKQLEWPLLSVCVLLVATHFLINQEELVEKLTAEKELG